MSSKKKVIAIAITTVALSVSSIGISQASQISGMSKTVAMNVSTHGYANSMGDTGDHQKVLISVLAVLVTKGTITQSQSDSITAAVSAARIAADAAKDAAKVLERASKALENDGNHSAREALIALTLGIDDKVLHSRSKAGESLATIAGVKKDALIAALVLNQTKRIDAFLAAGKITVARAITLKAGLVVLVTAEVNAAGDKKGGHNKGEKIGQKD